jgi:hypothetical protein
MQFIVPMLVKKFKRAKRYLPESEKYLEDLSKSIPLQLQNEWAAKEAAAVRQGGDGLSIYDVSTKHGVLRAITDQDHSANTSSAPTKSTVQLNLIEEQVQSGSDFTSISWLVMGLEIEQIQSGLDLSYCSSI